MHSTKQTIEEAIAGFTLLRNHSPYRFGGKWFIVKVADGFTAYRTKKAATNNAVGPTLWEIQFGR